jgi:hypothetical protein
VNDQHGPDDVSGAAGLGGVGGVGGVGEEAAKLLGALGDWAKEVGDHVDTGAAECSYCPLCRTVHVFREASPEVRTHLTTAAVSLMQAAAGILSAATHDSARSHHQPSVERIDLDGGASDWPEDPS